jgi:hypothetical protein
MVPRAPSITPSDARRWGREPDPLSPPRRSPPRPTATASIARTRPPGQHRNFDLVEVQRAEPSSGCRTLSSGTVASSAQSNHGRCLRSSGSARRRSRRHRASAHRQFRAGRCGSSIERPQPLLEDAHVVGPPIGRPVANASRSRVASSHSASSGLMLDLCTDARRRGFEANGPSPPITRGWSRRPAARPYRCKSGRTESSSPACGRTSPDRAK